MNILGLLNIYIIRIMYIMLSLAFTQLSQLMEPYK